MVNNDYEDTGIAYEEAGETFYEGVNKDELVFIVSRKLNLVHGQDFWCGAYIEGDTTSDPFIVGGTSWKSNFAIPTQNEVEKWREQYTTEYQAYAFETARTQATNEVIGIAESLVNAVVVDYPSTERNGWAEKSNIATAILEETATEDELALFAKLAEVRGDDTAVEFAKRILAKAETFKQLSYTIHEVKNRALKDIETANDTETVHAVQDAAITKMQNVIEGA